MNVFGWYVLLYLSLFCFQKEVIDKVGKKVLELGLLFGTEIPQEEETDAFWFQHVALQEFTAAVFIARLDKVGTKSDVLCTTLNKILVFRISNLM